MKLLTPFFDAHQLPLSLHHFLFRCSSYWCQYFLSYNGYIFKGQQMSLPKKLTWLSNGKSTVAAMQQRQVSCAVSSCLLTKQMKNLSVSSSFTNFNHCWEGNRRQRTNSQKTPYWVAQMTQRDSLRSTTCKNPGIARIMFLSFGHTFSEYFYIWSYIELETLSIPFSITIKQQLRLKLDYLEREEIWLLFF